MKMSTNHPFHAVWFLVIALACGPKPDAVEPEIAPEPEPEPEAVDEGMQIEGITGTLSQTDVNDTMELKALPAYNLCFAHYLEKKEFVFGSIDMEFVVASSGKTTEVRLLETTFGDRDLEKCILGKSTFLKFPKPSGGATEVSYSFDTEVLEGVKVPTTLHAGKFETALAPFMQDVEQCLGTSSGYVITFYVGDTMTEETVDEKGKTMSSTTSKVLSLGGYGPEGAPLEPIDCLLDASASWKIMMDVDGVGKVTLIL